MDIVVQSVYCSAPKSVVLSVVMQCIVVESVVKSVVMQAGRQPNSLLARKSAWELMRNLA